MTDLPGPFVEPMTAWDVPHETLRHMTRSKLAPDIVRTHARESRR